MGRPAKFSAEQILDTTAQLVAQGGPASATVTGIAQRLGAPTGSIYHRFESRDLLLARLWVRTVKRSQRGALEALAQEDVERAAIDTALHMVRWSRQHVEEACVLLLYRREQLAEQWPEELGDELAGLNTALVAALRTFVRRRFGSVTKANYEVAGFALVDVPYAAVRRYLLKGEPPPRSVDDLVERTCRCVLL